MSPAFFLSFMFVCIFGSRPALAHPPPSTDRLLLVAAVLEADRIVTASGNLYGKDQHSARGLDRRVILNPRGSGDDRVWQASRYELSSDPGEQKALLPMAGDPVEAAARAALLAAEEGVQGEAASVNEEALRALGYVE